MADWSPRRVGPFTVAALGFGCMNLSHAYGQPPEPQEALRVLHAALDQGITMFDTAALYGFGKNESLVGPVLKAHRSRIVLASKGGMAGVDFPDGVKRVIDGRPEALRRNCEDSLRRLGTDHIDLYYLHRWDKRVPIEESVGEMARLKQEGKIGALGLSEVSAATLQRGHAEHPIAALQTEYSLWTRNPEIAVLQACKTLGVAFVAFSPLGRGFLTSAPPDVTQLHAQDIRRMMPRFEPAHHARNSALLPGLQALAQAQGCTVAQLALAWLLARAEHIVPIPGTTQVAHQQDNAGALQVRPSAECMAALEQLINPRTVSGSRYNPQGNSEVDTEEFALG